MEYMMMSIRNTNNLIRSLTQLSFYSVQHPYFISPYIVVVGAVLYTGQLPPLYSNDLPVDTNNDYVYFDYYDR